MAFPMYLTAAWLVSVLAAQRGGDAVWNWMLAAIGSRSCGLGVVAFAHAGARWRRSSPLSLCSRRCGRCRRSRAAAGACGRKPSVGATAAVPYSEARLAAARARTSGVRRHHRRLVHHPQGEREGGARARSFRDALPPRTRPTWSATTPTSDPQITASSRRYRAVGIPLYVVCTARRRRRPGAADRAHAELVRDALAQAAK